MGSQIEIILSRVYRDIPLLGYVFCKISREPDSSIPTLGVTPNNILKYNPEFLEQISNDYNACKYVLFHEWLHLSLRHFERADSLTRKLYNQSLHDFMNDERFISHMSKLNIAMDVAINQICDRKFMRPDKYNFIHMDTNFKTITGIDEHSVIETDREWEYYFNLIPADFKGTKGYADIHENSIIRVNGGEMDNGIEDIIKESIAVQQAEDTHKPSSRRIIDALPKCLIKVDDKDVWKSKLLKSLNSSEYDSCRSLSMRKPDRRTGYFLSKRRNKDSTNYKVVIIDTSYSCDKLIEDFIKIINTACDKYNILVDVLLVNTEVYNVYEKISRIKIEDLDVLTGGTDLTTAQRYIMNKYTKDTEVVVLTDGFTDWLGTADGWVNPVNVIYTQMYRPLPNVKKFIVVA